MSVKPDIIAHLPPPPKPIRMLLVNDSNNKRETVALTLQVAGKAVKAFRVGNEDGPTTTSAESHAVEAECLADSEYYLWEWGPAATADLVEVFVTLNGAKKSAKAHVLPG